MAFTNASDFQDDFRKVGTDATAEFAPAGSSSNPTEYASSENLDLAGKKTDDPDEEDADLEDDEDLDEDQDDDEDEDDLEDEDDEDDLDSDDDEDDDEDEDEDEDDLEDDEDEDEEDEDDLEDDSTAVKARLKDAENRVRGNV